MSRGKNILALTASIAALGGGIFAAEKGVFHDSRGDIDDSPAVERKLEAVIKPKMQELGGLTVGLLAKTHGKDVSDTKSYDPATNIVTIDASSDNPAEGLNIVSAEFAAIPGTHQPDTKNVLHVEVYSRDNEDDSVISQSNIELAAPDIGSLDSDGGHSSTGAYSASRNGGVEFEDDSSLGSTYLFNTRDNDTFVDSEWDNPSHNPLPTAKVIVNDDGRTADIIRTAFEQ